MLETYKDLNVRATIFKYHDQKAQLNPQPLTPAFETETKTLQKIIVTNLLKACSDMEEADTFGKIKSILDNAGFEQRGSWQQDQHPQNNSVEFKALGFNNTLDPSQVLKHLDQALFLCSTFWSKMENGHLFSSSLPRLDKCHKTSRLFTRTEKTFVPVTGVLVSFLELRFLGKMALLALIRCPQSLSKSPLKVKRDIFT